MNRMKPKYLFFIIMVVVSLLVTGCTTNPPSSTITTTTTEFPQTTIPVTVVSSHPWTCYGSGNIYSVNEPRTPIVYSQSDPDTPHYHSLPAPQPTPAYSDRTMQNDPIIGTYIFDPSQFASKDVEKLDYFSTLSSSEFYYIVPLDVSPDIKWTFRDDGVLLFFQNNINCSDTSLRRFWRNSSGYFLRSGTWKIVESENYKTTYQITWGCTVQGTHNYIVTLDKNGVTLTQPTVLKMIKIG